MKTEIIPSDVGVEVMSLKEWRAKNGIGRNMAYKLIEEGLPSFRPGERKIFVLIKEAAIWLKNHESTGAI